MPILKTVSVGKSMKVNLGNYSNMDVRVDMTFEVSTDEQVSWNDLWDQVNYQLFEQTGDIDPSWIETKGHKDFTKIILRIPKQND